MRTIQRVSDLLITLSTASIAFMIVFITLNVLLRPLGHSILGIDEICEYLMPAVCFFSFPIAIRRGHNVSVDLVTSHLPPNVERKFGIFSNIVLMLFCATMVWLGFKMVWGAFASKQVTVLLTLKTWPWQVVLPVGMLMAIVEAIRLISEKLEGK